MLKISGEKLSAQIEAVEPFKAELKSKIDELKLSLHQVYNADESALYWKLLPNMTLVSHTESEAPGKKANRERLTFMPCSNLTGTNRPASNWKIG